ncbi:molybdopterin-binding protein [Fodinisporobacter ferrooxydans]|uniref:Molybdopterin molybdenumtransferase n=1 Tax=Fodinisporobacter ferrooxydans TaxID=2901836 RepID=A0ABY4CQG9_9BACL|nr:molybdopterin-binding protein [Alicyclobacillaceae bacterium MYW30-H2]
MKEVHVTDAIGMILGHDLTKIVPGEFKGRLFKKGHRIREEDIPQLLNIGKEHIFVMEIPPGYVHENDGAQRMAEMTPMANVNVSEPHEGKVVVKSNIHGLFRVNPDRLYQLNCIGELAVVTKKTFTVVKENDSVAAFRVIPLIVKESKLFQMDTIVNRNTSDVFLEVQPFRSLRVGIVTTGSEIAKGRIEDRFGPVIKRKVESYGAFVHRQIIVGDEQARIVEALETLRDEGCELLICTGGMSVDPDDRTPSAIRTFATQVIGYGIPMLPGTMLMLAYHHDIPVFGLPGAVMFDAQTSFDFLLPRVLAGCSIQANDLAELGHGGYL